MPEFPIQIEKVQAPPLRDDILSRPRLLDWLTANVRKRVVLVTAEAGYGKTTLLADFARRTDLRVLWYRLDRGDRDWVGFLAYLLAAVRVHLPEFGPKTDALVRATGSTATTLETVLETFIRELADLPPDPTVLILDDFQLVDESADVARAVNELLARSPTRLSLLVTSRRRPRLRFARLRTLSDVAELSSADLRFAHDELTELLAPGTAVTTHGIDEIERRTEGWPASIQLVRSALRDRSPSQTRALVRSLSGAEAPLYEYLAEEVIGDLPQAMQEFLMTSALLETVDAELSSVVSGQSPADAIDLIAGAERHGLLGRVGTGDPPEYRAHPLVREYLIKRLTTNRSRDQIRRLHLAVADAAAPSNWRIAASHYGLAGEAAAAERIVEANIIAILGTGAIQAADELLRGSGSSAPSATRLVLQSRIALNQGDGRRASALAEDAIRMDPTSPAAAIALMAARTFSGDVAGGVAAATNVADAQARNLANAYRLTLETSLEGSIDTALHSYSAPATVGGMAAARFRGISECNHAQLLKAQGRAVEALVAADEAISAFEAGPSDIAEVSARLTRGWALAHMGNLHVARQSMEVARATAPAGQSAEVAGEIAELEFYYGDITSARTALEGGGELDGEGRAQALLVASLLAARGGDIRAARRSFAEVAPRVLHTTVAFEARRLLTDAYLALMSGDESASQLARAATEHAQRQGAHLWASYGGLLSAFADQGMDPSPSLVAVSRRDPAVISMAAEIVGSRLGDLDAEAFRAIQSEAGLRPDRWRSILRQELASPINGAAAAALLAAVGEPSDVARIRDEARQRRDVRLVGLTRQLARRVAPVVEVLDLGRVRIRRGSELVDGSSIRRKVLALLCFLVARPTFSASREEVIENLWPDQDPDDGLNSLNQTAYFLRRVFEPGFQEALSPGYLRQDGETIWLDRELVRSRAAQCLGDIEKMPDPPSVADALAVLDSYDAPFALDFMYEEWASRFREQLHSSVLRVLEQAIRVAAATRQFGPATQIAERAVRLDPESDELQVALIHLYRASGAPAAAADRYAIYAASLRSMGLDAPAYEELEVEWG